jgi:hypothetical protein
VSQLANIRWNCRARNSKYKFHNFKQSWKYKCYTSVKSFNSYSSNCIVRFQKVFIAKAYHAIIWGQCLAYKSITNIFQTSRGVTKVRNSNKINHLPFEDLPLVAIQRVPATSQMVVLFDKVLLYIKNLFNWRAWFSNPPVSLVQNAYKWIPKVNNKLCPNKSNKVSNQSSGTLICK